ncbi:MAG: hypothetical protein ACI8RZ_004989 [Myxococcota bacterium]|jgi:hypothetical protein
MLLSIIRNTEALIGISFWPLLGLLAVHAVLCVRLTRRARRGIAIPPHLWSGLPMVIGLVGWLLCLSGFVVGHVNYAVPPPFTRQQLLMQQLSEVLEPAMFASLLGAVGLLWASVFAAIARQPRSAGRCLSLSLGSLLVVVGLSIPYQYATMLNGIDAVLAPPLLPLLNPLAGLTLAAAGLTLFTRPAVGPRWWRGFGVGTWAPVVANLSALVCCMAIWYTHLLCTGLPYLQSLQTHFDDLPTTTMTRDALWWPQEHVVILSDEALRGPQGPWISTVLAVPADMRIRELPWPEWLRQDPLTAEMEQAWMELEQPRLEGWGPDLSLQIVVCPTSTPPLLPGWLEAIYPTRPLHCTTMRLPAALRESSGDLTVQQAVDALY